MPQRGEVKCGGYTAHEDHTFALTYPPKGKLVVFLRRDKAYSSGMGTKRWQRPQAQFVVNAQGKKAGVLLSPKQDQKLLEDLHDLAVIATRRDEEAISLEEMQRRLQPDGGV